MADPYALSFSAFPAPETWKTSGDLAWWLVWVTGLPSLPFEMITEGMGEKVQFVFVEKRQHVLGGGFYRIENTNI